MIFEQVFAEKQQELNVLLQKRLAIIQGTTIEFLVEAQNKQMRLVLAAMDVINNPVQWIDKKLNGILLVDLPTANSVANAILAASRLANETMENLHEEFDAKMLQLANCTTIQEVESVTW